jgi:hypothetical protein
MDSQELQGLRRQSWQRTVEVHYRDNSSDELRSAHLKHQTSFI